MRIHLFIRPAEKPPKVVYKDLLNTNTTKSLIEKKNKKNIEK